MIHIFLMMMGCASDKILAMESSAEYNDAEGDYATSDDGGYSYEELEQAEIQLKYRSYIEAEKENVERLLKLENKKINSDFDYSTVKSLSLEAVDKLNKIKPKNIGQASRISGVSPADISVLIVHFGR